LYGVDIAKTAVRLAAKRVGGHGRFLVADVYDKLPFADQSVQVLLNSFAPRHAAEFARLLVPGGLLLVAAPAPDHLQSLRAYFGLMGIQDAKEAFIKAQFASLFALQNVENLVIPLRLDNSGLLGLINMMPGVRHLSPEQWKAIYDTPQIETTASFLVLQMQRVADERFTG
ncbi:MAG: methyltransferase domain-containing protein, partial [Anaerolineae bacterium]|nr:methyltransferase domain-containing protein [Anaerolineae bacterium]